MAWPVHQVQPVGPKPRSVCQRVNGWPTPYNWRAGYNRFVATLNWSKIGRASLSQRKPVTAENAAGKGGASLSEKRRKKRKFRPDSNIWRPWTGTIGQRNLGTNTIVKRSRLPVIWSRITRALCKGMFQWCVGWNGVSSTSVFFTKTVPIVLDRKSSNLPQSPNLPFQNRFPDTKLQRRRHSICARTLSGTWIGRGKRSSNSCASQHLTRTLALAINYM